MDFLDPPGDEALIKEGVQESRPYIRSQPGRAERESSRRLHGHPQRAPMRSQEKARQSPPCAGSTGHG